MNSFDQKMYQTTLPDWYKLLEVRLALQPVRRMARIVWCTQVDIMTDTSQIKKQYALPPAHPSAPPPTNAAWFGPTQPRPI